MTDMVLAKRRLHEPSWEPGYALFSKVINDLQLKVGAEIGVAFGGHSEAILRQTKVDRLYGVDRYKHQKDYADPMNLPQRDFDALYEMTKKRLSVHGNRFVLIRSDSKAAIDRIEGELDFVFIDADHSYEGVMRDLCSWFNKINVGGVLGGHDYDHPDFPGVKRAIHDFFDRFSWRVHSEGEGVWWVLKEALSTSVFIPAYNCASTITEAVESVVLGNLQSEDEIIIVDDGSNDRTPDVLATLRARYPQIRLFHHPLNKGGGAARNTCIENASNQILFCLDSDNVLVTGSLSLLKQFLITTGVDVATFQEAHYFERPGHISHKWRYKSGVTTLADYLSGHIHAGSSGNYMFTKESWARAGCYPESAGPLDTWGFGLRQLASGSRMGALPGSYYYHRLGFESYWLRESKKIDLSLVASQLLSPFRHLIRDDDWDYITKSKNHDWFDRLAKRAIRLKQSSKGKSGLALVKMSGWHIRLAKRIINTLLLALGEEKRAKVKVSLKSVLR